MPGQADFQVRNAASMVLLTGSFGSSSPNRVDGCPDLLDVARTDQARAHVPLEAAPVRERQRSLQVLGDELYELATGPIVGRHRRSGLLGVTTLP
jgi:hypothetical protein